MENAQIAKTFEEIADLLELQDGNQFRIRSYRSAARTIRDRSERMEDMVAEDKDLTELANIGGSMAEKIKEIVETGTCQRLEEQREKVPPGLVEVMRVPGVGPKTAMQLNKELGVTSLDELKAACEDDTVSELDGMGQKTQEKIMEGITTLKRTSGRILLQEAESHIESLQQYLDDIDDIDRWVVAGSYRRRKETVGDLDILVESGDRDAVADAIADYGEVSMVDSRGKERVTVHLNSGLQVDFRFFEGRSFGAAMLYFTGSKAHNIALRKRAQSNDWKLNEYGLLKGDNLLAGKDEESVYERLNMAWVPPELREDRGEIDAAIEDNLPDLVTLDDIRGDLQSHTDATDGQHTIKEMADAAAERGYSYFAITDHSKRVTMAQGLDDTALRKHAGKIRRADHNYDNMWLMAGVEVDILKSGKLDLETDTLRQMDWVVASIHYDRNMSEEDMTARIIRAIESGVVHCIGHPLGRIIGRRDPIEVDFAQIIQACAKNRVCLEINAQPDRLDLPEGHIKQAKEAGVMLTIGTDAHKASSLGFMKYGVSMARRGWLERSDILNTKTVKQLRTWLDRRG